MQHVDMLRGPPRCFLFVLFFYSIWTIVCVYIGIISPASCALVYVTLFCSGSSGRRADRMKPCSCPDIPVFLFPSRWDQMECSGEG